MAATKFVIIVASETKAIRRVIYPDDDKQIDSISVAAGEGMLVFQIKETGDLDQWKTLVERATGVYPPDPLCAIVDPKDNSVVSVIMADPNLDAHPDGHDLVAAYSDKISVGDTYDKAADLFVKPAYVAPEYIDRQTNQVVAAKQVEAQVIDRPIVEAAVLK